MSERKNKIMQFGDRGYVKGYDNISLILRNFLSCTMRELNSSLPQHFCLYDYAIDAARRLGNIEFPDRTSVENLRLSELLCIMKYYENTFSDPGDVLISYMKTLCEIIACPEGPSWAALFMDIPIKSLMEYFNKETGTNKYSALYLSICSLSKECAGFEVTDITTLGQFFDGTADSLYASWNPGSSKDEYFDKIENSCMLIKSIFINGIADWQYDKFNIIDFLEKYDNMFEENSNYIVNMDK